MHHPAVRTELEWIARGNADKTIPIAASLLKTRLLYQYDSGPRSVLNPQPRSVLDLQPPMMDTTCRVPGDTGAETRGDPAVTARDRDAAVPLETTITGGPDPPEVQGTAMNVAVTLTYKLAADTMLVTSNKFYKDTRISWNNKTDVWSS
jgi:hypothetical protein